MFKNADCVPIWIGSVGDQGRRPSAALGEGVVTAGVLVTVVAGGLSIACNFRSSCSVRCRNSCNSRFSASTSTASAPSTAPGGVLIIPNKTTADSFLIIFQLSRPPLVVPALAGLPGAPRAEGRIYQMKTA